MKVKRKLIAIYLDSSNYNYLDKKTDKSFT